MAIVLCLILTFWITAVSCKLVNPLPVVEPYGSKFFDALGNQFLIRGVAYQPGGSSTVVDPLANGGQCKIDAQLLKELGANVIRVYTVFAASDHDECMQAFNDAGIYVLIDLPTPTHSINRAQWSWTLDLYDSYTSSFDAFAEYDNLLGVHVGNEAVNDMDTAEVALYIKAAARDVKEFRDFRGYRKVPVGYSNADVSAINPFIQYYLSCGGNPNETVDFFSYNDYAWCGDSSYTQAGYDTKVKYASKSNIPIFFSEEGCNNDPPRKFTDQPIIFSDPMLDVWSGTIIYEWSEEASEYGLVDYGGDTPSSGFTVTPTILSDYSALSKQWATITPSTVKKSNYSPSIPTPVCPSSTASGWPIDPSIGPPTIAGLEISTVSRVTTISPTLSGTGSKTKSKTAGSGTTASASGSAQPSSSSSVSSSSSSSTSSTSGLSASAKIALGVSIPIGVILITVLVIFAVRRHKKKRNAKPVYKDVPDAEKPELAGVPVSQLESHENQIKPRREELDSRPVRLRAHGDGEDGGVWELPGDEVRK